MILRRRREAERQKINSRLLELQAAKGILAEILHAKPKDIQDIIRGRLKERSKYICSHEQLDILKEIILSEFEEMNKTLDINNFTPAPSIGKCISCQFCTICSYSAYSKDIGETSLSAGDRQENAKTDLLSSASNDNIPADELLENAFLLNQGIDDLQKQLGDLKNEYHSCIELAKNRGINEQGAYRLKKIISKIGRVEAKAFREAYPDLFFELATIPTASAERLVGEEAMKELVTYILRETYAVTKIQRPSDTSGGPDSSNQ
jgi:hypothetical protein